MYEKQKNGLTQSYINGMFLYIVRRINPLMQLPRPLKATRHYFICISFILMNLEIPATI